MIDVEQSDAFADLSGRPGLLWLRDSQTGAVRVTERGGHGIALNAALHANA